MCVCACRAGRAASIFKGLARSYQTLQAAIRYIIYLYTYNNNNNIYVENADVIKSIPKFSVYILYTHKTYYASDVIASVIGRETEGNCVIEVENLYRSYTFFHFRIYIYIYMYTPLILLYI